MNELLAIVRQLRSPFPAPAVLATLVTVSGSSYRRPGARLLITADRLRLGSISGGCLEEDVIARAAMVASTGLPEKVTYDTTSENDLVWGVGLGCHGVVQVLLERISTTPRWADVLASNLASHAPTPLAVVWEARDPSRLGTRLADELPPQAENAGIFFDTIPPLVPLVIFGAGDDARPLVRFAKEFGWHVTVADPRRDFVTADRFPAADALVAGPAHELVARTGLRPGALAVVMTHHYVHDVPILRDLFGRDPRYVGLLGPKKRAERILADLAHEGVVPSDTLRQRLHAPVGLDLGSTTPEEVALSIIAEMRAVLGGRDARSLRWRERPIHS
jgi:xanthine/CO dehydrogenase XdhC/CoxF family maturation factor